MPTRRAATKTSAALVWTAILILYLAWGSTYLGIRIAVSSIPPFAMAAVRFAIAGAVLAYAQAGRRPTRGRSGPKCACALASRLSAVLRSAHGAVYRRAQLAFAVWG